MPRGTRQHRSSARAAALAGALLLGSFFTAHAQSITAIPPGPGYAHSAATYVAPGGAVVGVSFNPGLYAPRPTRWASANAEGVLLGASPAGGSGEPIRCSDDGNVVVGRWNADVNTTTPAVWDAGGAYAELPGPGSQSEANGVSADGAIVTGWSATGEGRWLLRWQDGAPTQRHGGGAGSGFVSGPCSADGTMAIGTAYLGGSAANLSRWTLAGGPDGSIRTLAPFPSTWTNIRRPTAMTPAGDAAVGVAYTGGTTYQSWIWRAGEGGEGRITDMGLPEGAKSITALGISADGSVVVGTATVQSTRSSGGRQAKVWTPQAGWQGFSDWLTARGVSFPGWTFNTLGCVSADGRTFAGEGRTPDGKTRGFVITIGP
ncbi:MAG: hypothetical protein WD749_14505 [Phycisphaerales bacterium]